MINNKGFTLLEMIITMGLVVGVIIITGSAFNTILKNSASLTSSEESNIEGVVGLEMFRHDLQQAGFGLPDAYDNPAISYSEATVAPANLLNDNAAVPPVPRALASIDAISGKSDSGSETTTYNLLDGTDYLAVKATTVGRSSAAKKWTFVTYSAGPTPPFSGKAPNRWPNSEDNFKYRDRAIVVKRNFLPDGSANNIMIYNNNNTGDPAIYWPNDPTTNMNDDFNPKSGESTFYLYGVDSYSAAGLGMPFNRADFFVARPSDTSKVPGFCAPNTGILYKTTVNHNGGKLFYMPLLDCVADMQVVFGWENPLGSGLITETSANGASTPTAIAAWMASPTEIRNRLKYVKVYIMAQDGRKDTNYVNQDTLGPGNNTYAVVVGDPGPNPPSNISLTKAYTSAQLSQKDWQNYRWKTYRIVVRPKNLTN